MWSRINVRSSIRLTGGRQIDFKVFKPFLNAKKYFIKLKFKIPKIDRVNFLSEKVNKYFLKK